MPPSTYIVTDISPPGALFSSAFAINNAGHAAGRWEPGRRISRGFAYIRHAIIDIGPLPGRTSSRAEAINNANQIVGYSFSRRDGSDGRAFLWESGVMTDLHPTVTLGGTASWASAINEAGHIAGDATKEGDLESRAFLYQPGSVTHLGTLGGSYSWARALSNGDIVVGGTSIPGDSVARAFQWVRDAMTDLGELGGNSQATAISESGVVVGVAFLPGDSVMHASRMGRGGLSDIHPSMLGRPNSMAFGINNRGQIVGFASPTTNDDLKDNIAVLWEDDGVYDLNSFIPVGSGWLLHRAAAINNHGEIVGVGAYGGRYRAFLLSPVEERRRGPRAKGTEKREKGLDT